jgi:acyl transferase domain-containing protein/NAD(P)H-dependent flavin oxidoreductase YrpB (nitropropane dioxygenase family)
MFVATLPGWPDARVLRAAARAGATAVLDLEGVTDPTSVLSTVASGLPHGQLAVRVDSVATWQIVQAWPLASLKAVLLTPDVVVSAADAPALVRAAGCEVLLECTAVDDAHLGAVAGVDGLVVKGHEAGGSIGEETTFVLVQRVRAAVDLPIFAHGGIGPRTAAACLVAGCDGVVLDSQVLLTRESSLDEGVKSLIARMAGDETRCLGGDIGLPYRVYRRPGLTALAELDAIEAQLCATDVDPSDVGERWSMAIRQRINWRTGPASLWPLGQDAALAAPLAQAHRSVAGVLSAISTEAIALVEAARELKPLAPGAPLAVANGTAVPILQGPMTRVSDVVPFAAAVAEGGGLPFLALALLRGPQVRTLLKQASEQLAGRPWGVGILGFVPLELRDEQLAVIEEFRPPFALIAGGRPDQAAKLERLGITTYLHVPAPSLLKMFLDDGARRFIFEGRECGGHVGPRTSFVLWELMVTTLLEAVTRGVPAEDLHVVFAGGIHDALSAAMVSAIAAPLSRVGVRVGALMGTAYLFTEEAVTSGAIVETFQQEALECSTTVLLESGPGHATRCADTAFCDTFRRTRRELVASGRTGDELRLELESLNLGRLRVASKGIRRAADGEAAAGHVEVGVEEQRQAGMYMIGQVAALRSRVCRVADLHRDVSEGSVRLLAELPSPTADAPAPTAASLHADVAIIGLGCLLPDAPDVRTLWQNVLRSHDAIREIPKDRFDSDRYYDPDRKKADKIYSKWGGFLDEVPVDPLKHGIPPSAMPSIDPFQLLTLEVVDQALKDAGYGDRPFNRERTSVILGASGGVGDLGFRYGIRAGLPMFLDDVAPEVLDALPTWTEDSFAGVLLNVAAGRVANRLDLGGLNFTVDAACASSLAAVYMAARELEAGSSDMVLVGGIDTVNSPFGYLCFSSAQALSPRGRCSTFDEQADGIAISEGLTVLVLKRLADAERDGDRIYSVIRGVAGSSDGRGKGLTAPRPEGQMRVLERAYAAAGISPATVGLVEAHGTGTVAGDGAEVSALSRVFGREDAAPQSCAIGSIKSMIGHTKSAAGVTGLLKVALSLHHKVLPPTLHVTRPNGRLQAADTPFYVNVDARPWVAPGNAVPRRAGVSSFGFGGTNFHVVMEEYDGQARGVLPEQAVIDEWPAELFVWTAPTALDLVAGLDRLDAILNTTPTIPLRVVAASVGRVAADQDKTGQARLAIVATSVADLRGKLAIARNAVATDQAIPPGSDSIFLDRSGATPGSVAFLFPGQGSQYPGMHRELAMHFAEMRHALELADACTAGVHARRLSRYILPPPAFTPAEREARMGDITDTSVAQPALGAVEMGLVALLERFGIRPDLTAGHSYGEYVALWAAGAFPAETLMALSVSRGQFMRDASADNAGTMAAVVASPERIADVLGDRVSVSIANLNSPRQTVIAGSAVDIDAASQLLTAAGITTRRLAVSCAFHSPLVGAAQARMADLLAQTTITPPRLPVFANALAGPYPAGTDQMREVLARHLVSPVRFAEQVEAMYAAGARTFIEVGPKGVLTSLVREILAGREAVTVALNARDTPELPHLLRLLGQLVVAGVPVALAALWEGRSIPAVRVEDLARTAPTAPPAHAWMVSGGRARPLTPRKVAAKTQPERPAAAAIESNQPSVGTRVEPVQPVAVTAPVVDKVRDPAPPVSPDSASPAVVVPQRTSQRQTPYLSGGGVMQQHPVSGIVGAMDQHEIVRQFQQIMGQFLQTQALVMTAYLQGSPQATATPALPPAPVPRRPELRIAAEAQQARLVVPSVAVPSAPAPVAAPVPASVVAQVPTPLAPVAVAPPAPAIVPEPVRTPEITASAARMGEGDVLRELLRIVSDRTGYPEEMLTVDANIEADLGIDSIKRMEILGAFHETHVGGQRGAFQNALERLTALKTLRETAAALTEFLTDEPSAVAV